MEENKTSQNEQPMVEVGATNNQAEKRRRSQESESDPGVIRLKVGGALAVKVKEAAQELKSRGIAVTAEELLADYLENVPQRYFESQLLKWTPERFYIEAAIELPEVRERLVRQAKRSLGLFASKTGDDGSVPRRRRREKGTENTTQEG